MKNFMLSCECHLLKMTTGAREKTTDEMVREKPIGVLPGDFISERGTIVFEPGSLS
jgi:hypothetical protein